MSVALLLCAAARAGALDGGGTTAKSDAAQRESIHLRGDAMDVMRACMERFHRHLEMAQRPATPWLRVDLDDADLATTEQVLGWMTKMFFVEREAGYVLAVDDTRENRTRYRSTRTFPLNGLNTDERAKLQEMLERVLDVHASTETGEIFTVEADAATLDEVGRLVALMRKPRQDLLFKIHVYTLTDNHENNAGVQPPASTQSFSLMSEAQELINDNSSVVEALIASGEVTSSDTLEIALLLLAAGYTTSDLSNGFVYFGGGLTYMGMSFSSTGLNMQLTDTRLREIDSTTLRVADRESGKLRIGERYPIETSLSVYYSYTTSGTWTESTTPNVEYEDIGLTLELEPRLLGNGQVYVDLNWRNQTLSGSSINDVPVLDRREMQSAVLLPLGATTVLTGHLGRESVSDTAGLSSNSDKSRSGTDVLMTITPELASAAEAAELPAMAKQGGAALR